ncbi:MAG TPA: AraC family transcriptional regulator, partial [Clostridia bacterium]|nr:AraC family transcriptional regulator [Clostridia bacterium]
KNREDAPPGAFPLLIHELYITGMRYLASRNQMLPDAERYRALLKSDPLWNDNQVDLLHAFLDEVVAQTDTQPTPAQPNLSDTIAAYVQAHYAQDLYLERIAQDMGLSVKYLSKVFKDKTGENLSDYINRVRMEHVRDMLKNTDMSINDISQAVGIFSRSTFTRVFRKLEGVTPSEYRELVREQGNAEKV